MNDRIKELERECWEPRKHPVSQAAMGDKFNTEKFAALIVAECLMCCGAVHDASVQHRGAYDAFGLGAEKCQVVIKTHFGVLE